MRQRSLLSGILFICSFLTATTVFALPTFQFFVEDNTQPTPQSVGFVISVSEDTVPSDPNDPSVSNLLRNVMTMVPIAKVPQPVTAADWWKIGLRIDPNEIPYHGALWFTGTTCGGSLWIEETLIHSEFDPAFDPYVVVGSGDPFSRILIVADPEAPFSQPMDFNSVLSGNGECIQKARTMRAKPGIDLLVDLHQMFPPPYKLQFNVLP